MPREKKRVMSVEIKWKVKDVELAVVKIVREQTSLDRRHLVTPSAFFGDLKLDYTDLILIVSDCIRAFDIKIGEDLLKGGGMDRLITIVRASLREEGRLIE